MVKIDLFFVLIFSYYVSEFDERGKYDERSRYFRCS